LTYRIITENRSVSSGSHCKQWLSGNIQSILCSTADYGRAQGCSIRRGQIFVSSKNSIQFNEAKW
jgi:hypothetical protein